MLELLPSLSIARQLTFRPIPHCLADLSRNLKEDWNTAQNKPQSTPEIFDDKVFHEAMVQPPAQNTVHMLDQREIALIQVVFLRLVAAIQRNFLTVVNQSRVLEPELSLQPRLISDVFPERRRQHAHHIGRQLNQKTHQEETLHSDVFRQLVIVDDHVQDGFRQVRIQLRQAVGETGDIDGDELIWVLDAVIQSRQGVEGHVGQVFFMHVVGQALPVLQRQPTLVV